MKTVIHRVSQTRSFKPDGAKLNTGRRSRQALRKIAKMIRAKARETGSPIAAENLSVIIEGVKAAMAKHPLR